ncbi:MAG TPA: hypothetical protein VND89_01735 [Acidimicrobiales bacterium]|nr:hypothetical protein [Acidimicrobiales bacterium]
MTILNSYTRRQTTLWKALLAGSLLLAALGAAGVRASGAAPSTLDMTTVTDVATTSANLSSTANPGGTDTTAWFAYGVSTADPAADSTTPVQDLGAGTAPVPISAILTGLTAGTTYYVWLVTHVSPLIPTSTGTTDWGLSSFTTTGGPTTTVGPTTPNITTMTMHDTRLGLNLTAVSCPTTSRCWATGSVAVSETKAVAVIVQLNNRVWTASSTPVPEGTNENLNGIDCLSTTSCWAVGARETPSGEYPTALHYNGRKWTSVSVPTPSTIAANYLSAVTCPSAKSCWAVGGKEGATSLGRALVEHYNGRSWSVVASPGPGDDTLLSAVSCPSARSCWAVGTSNDAAVSSKIGSLIEHYNGHSWSQAKAPHVRYGLFSVSCQWSASCFTNGLRYIGGAWQRVSGFSGTSAISCSTSSSCWAVDYSTGAQFWDGTTWSSVTGPSVPSGHAGALEAIACSPGGPCAAVGSVTPKTSTGGTARSAVFKTQALAELLGIGQF